MRTDNRALRFAGYALFVGLWLTVLAVLIALVAFWDRIVALFGG